jgi:hypothetical protein
VLTNVVRMKVQRGEGHRTHMKWLLVFIFETPFQSEERKRAKNAPDRNCQCLAL